MTTLSTPAGVAAAVEALDADVTARLAGKLTSTANLGDVASASAARVNLGLGNVANLSPAQLADDPAIAAAIAAGGGGGGSAAGQTSPADRGVLAWTMDPAQMGLSQGITSLGNIYATRMNLPTATINRVNYRVQTAGGATLTPGQNFVVIYRVSDLALVATSVDQTVNFGSTGVKTADLTAPVDITEGEYLVGFLPNGSGTAPQITRTPQGDSAMVHFGVAPKNNSRSCQVGGSGLTSPPATGTVGGATSSVYWLAIS